MDFWPCSSIIILKYDIHGNPTNIFEFYAYVFIPNPRGSSRAQWRRASPPVRRPLSGCDYKYVYRAVPPDRLKKSIEAMLKEWYRMMLSELDELPEKIEGMGCRSRG